MSLTFVVVLGVASSLSGDCESQSETVCWQVSVAVIRYRSTPFTMVVACPIATRMVSTALFVSPSPSIVPTVAVSVDVDVVSQLCCSQHSGQCMVTSTCRRTITGSQLVRRVVRPQLTERTTRLRFAQGPRRYRPASDSLRATRVRLAGNVVCIAIRVSNRLNG
jgi:hypothetical protein